MTTINQWLTDANRLLDPHTSSPHLEAELLLSAALKKEITYLITYREQLIPGATLEYANQLLQRRLKGEPIAYILGFKEFWSLSLYVNRHVLIPRPETERVVELALEKLPEHKKINVLDLGTGSGAIALALAKERPQWRIIATDISSDALAVANKNAQQLAVTNIHFIQSNWFEKLSSERFHAIISNPPYIAKEDIHLTQRDLQFEPYPALVAGEDGLEAIREIVKVGYDHLFPEGLLICEHGYDQGEPVLKLMNQSGFYSVSLYKDFSGCDRVCVGVRR